ncbi:MAG: hypothetical protein JRE57_00010 [Deltaproteobacteria bacterium]|nr:hypothetical protein [Deltaproteobacteria bacterium]
MKQRKEVPLRNFRARIDFDRIGMFLKVCEVHRVGFGSVNGTPSSYYLILTEESLLDDLYKNISTFIIIDNPDGALLLRTELANLEV